MELLRTPDERFENLPDFPYSPHYLEVPAGDGANLRMHFLDEGPPDGPVALLLHGEPSWSYLYRKMIPILVDAGLRAVAPDLPGFGRSDKPADPGEYSYQRVVDWMAAFVMGIDLQGINLFCQDWGGLVGLRLVAEHGERFERVIAANTGLPIGEPELPEAFKAWQKFATSSPIFPVQRIIQSGTATKLPKPVLEAYAAPFPEKRYLVAARTMPALVPTQLDDPAAAPNRLAWRKLMRWKKPFLTAFSDGDPITRGGEAAFQRLVPGAQGRQHPTIHGAAHFLQEDKGEELAHLMVDFIHST